MTKIQKDSETDQERLRDSERQNDKNSERLRDSERETNKDKTIKRQIFRDSDKQIGILLNRVENATKSRIRNVVGAGELSADSLLVLINLISFSGTWEHQFNPKKTHNGTFYLMDGTEIK